MPVIATATAVGVAKEIGKAVAVKVVSTVAAKRIVEKSEKRRKAKPKN